MTNDPLIDRSDEQKRMRTEKLRAELKEALRQSVPTEQAQRYWDLGWVYIMPDFDTPNHSIVEWQSKKMPVYPPRSDQQPTKNAAHERARPQRAT
jgi:hypothetical protein